MPLKVLLLLGGSCIAAIAAVGSVFELTATPRFGVIATVIILLITAPATFFLFTAALREAQATQD